MNRFAFLLDFFIPSDLIFPLYWSKAYWKKFDIKNSNFWYPSAWALALSLALSLALPRALPLADRLALLLALVFLIEDGPWGIELNLADPFWVAALDDFLELFFDF